MTFLNAPFYVNLLKAHNLSNCVDGKLSRFLNHTVFSNSLSISHRFLIPLKWGHNTQRTSRTTYLPALSSSSASSSSSSSSSPPPSPPPRPVLTYAVRNNRPDILMRVLGNARGKSTRTVLVEGYGIARKKRSKRNRPK